MKKNSVFANWKSIDFAECVMFKRKGIFLLMLILMLATLTLQAQRNMERLGRGTVAVRSSSSEVMVGWRILGLEFNANVRYNLYRGTTLIASNLNVSNYIDNTSSNSTYQVAAVVNGVEQAKSPAVSVNTYVHGSNTMACIRVPIRVNSGYSPNYLHVGDLDGDGEYDFIFTKLGSSRHWIEAYKRDGTFLWRLDAGPNSANQDNIEPGSSTFDMGHGDNWTVYDLNSDGKAEVIARVANGVIFGNGTTFTNPDNNRQFIAVLDGMTGAPLATIGVPTDYLADGPMNGHMGIAYLDGVKPSLVWSSKNRRGSGAFNHMISTYTWTGGSTITMNWKYLTNLPNGHNIRCGDYDGDGRDEICPFGFVLNENGTLLYNLGSQGVIHGDRFHIGDLDPDRPGLEGYLVQQRNPNLAWAVFDARTGGILARERGEGEDYGRGITGDFDPRYRGFELYTSGPSPTVPLSSGIYNVDGTRTSSSFFKSPPNMRIWWDGDLLAEHLDSLKLKKWDYENNREQKVYYFTGVIDKFRHAPNFYGDILGDWREEIVYVTNDQANLLIFTPVTPTPTRLYTLMHNPLYRLDCTNKGYNQAHHVDFYLGHGMTTPPTPNIRYVGEPEEPGTGTYEAENRTAQSGTTVATNQSGYTGTGFVDYGGEATWIEWNNIAGGAAGGVATLTFRYANAPAPDRQCAISVNGNIVGNLSFASTGAWNNWSTQSITAHLTAGNNTIRVTTNAGFTGPNLDNVSVVIMPAPSAYEAESHTAQLGTTVATNQSGYEGTGFVDYGGEGTWIEWDNIASSAGGNATLTFRYANAPAVDRQCAVTVNGTVVGNLSFASTGAWNNWNTQSVTANLNAGNNTIRVTANAGFAGPNLDNLTVSMGGSSARMAIEAQNVSEEESELIQVQPNPATNEITITVPSTYKGEKMINLFDGMGKVAMSAKFNGSKHTMHIGGLPSGMYILKIFNNKKMIVKKVLKN